MPASYGGFETLAENLVLAAEQAPELELEFTVFCSGGAGGTYHGAKLLGVPLKANGWQSVLYDAVSLWKSRNFDIVLVFGVSVVITLTLFSWLGSDERRVGKGFLSTFRYRLST